MGGHAKLANQILVAVTLAGMGEALVYGAKAGIDPALLVEAMSAGLARCGSLDIKAPKVLAGDFQPGGKVDSQVKDLRYAMHMARQLKVSLPVTAVVNELFHAVQYAGRGEWDHSAIVTLIEDMAGVTARSPCGSAAELPLPGCAMRLSDVLLYVLHTFLSGRGGAGVSPGSGGGARPAVSASR